MIKQAYEHIPSKLDFKLQQASWREDKLTVLEFNPKQEDTETTVMILAGTMSAFAATPKPMHIQ